MKLFDYFVLILLVASHGCGRSPERSSFEPVTLKELPQEILTAAKKAAPDVTFESALKTQIGGQDAFEVRGKTKAGKVREVEISTKGEVLAIE